MRRLQYEEFKEILSNSKMETVFEMLDKVNPPLKKQGGLEDDHRHLDPKPLFPRTATPSP
jgi:hypothetical protein